MDYYFSHPPPFILSPPNLISCHCITGRKSLSARYGMTGEFCIFMLSNVIPFCHFIAMQGAKLQNQGRDLRCVHSERFHTCHRNKNIEGKNWYAAHSAHHSAHQKRSKLPPINVTVMVTESFSVNRALKSTRRSESRTSTIPLIIDSEATIE